MTTEAATALHGFSTDPRDIRAIQAGSLVVIVGENDPVWVLKKAGSWLTVKLDTTSKSIRSSAIRAVATCWTIGVRGDSMEPLILDGDRITVDVREEVSHGDLVVVHDAKVSNRAEYSGCRSVVGFLEVRDGETSWMTKANPSYAPFRIESNRVLGKVVEIAARTERRLSNDQANRAAGEIEFLATFTKNAAGDIVPMDTDPTSFYGEGWQFTDHVRFEAIGTIATSELVSGRLPHGAFRVRLHEDQPGLKLRAGDRAVVHTFDRQEPGDAIACELEDGSIRLGKAGDDDLLLPWPDVGARSGGLALVRAPIGKIRRRLARVLGANLQDGRLWRFGS